MNTEDKKPDATTEDGPLGVVVAEGVDEEPVEANRRLFTGTSYIVIATISTPDSASSRSDCTEETTTPSRSFRSTVRTSSIASDPVTAWLLPENAYTDGSTPAVFTMLPF